jgi:hypothetical protein
MTIRKLAVAAIAGCAVAAPGPAPAVANEDDVEVTRRCTGPSRIELELSPEDGRLEVEVEVDQNRNGVRWHWTISRGSRSLATGTRLTRAPSGSFEVHRVVADRRGKDRITARAVRRGERCVVTATF